LYGKKGSWLPCYTYSVKDDLNPIFKSVGEIINKTLPIFESTLKHSFEKYPELTDGYANSNQYEIELCNRVLYVRKINKNVNKAISADAKSRARCVYLAEEKNDKKD
jgi:hypothetical protein